MRVWLAMPLAVAALTAACSDNGGDVATFCTAATDTARFEDVFDELDPTDIDAAIATFEQARNAQIELRTDAPGEVRQDIDVQVNFLDELIEGLQAADPASDERPDVYADLRPRFDEVEAAGNRLERWVDANC